MQYTQTLVRIVNPVVVRTPDGRVGCLVARHEMHGCVAFEGQQVLNSYPLVTLDYHITLAAPETRRKFRASGQMRKV